MTGAEPQARNDTWHNLDVSDPVLMAASRAIAKHGSQEAEIVDLVGAAYEAVVPIREQCEQLKAYYQLDGGAFSEGVHHAVNSLAQFIYVNKEAQ